MISLKKRLHDDYLMALSIKATKSALILDTEDYEEIMKEAVRKLNDIVYNPRHVLYNEVTNKVDVSDESIDEICQVLFSNDNIFSKILPGAGMLPLLFSPLKGASLDTAVDFLAMQGGMNVLQRQMKTAPDYELYEIQEGVDEHGEPILVRFLKVNGHYQYVMVEYLPYLDPEETEWWIFENEWQFLISYGWALLNLYSAEALMSSSALGVNKDSAAIAEYWKAAKEKLVTDFTNAGSVPYVG